MGGLGYIVGGALQGVGSGIIAQGQQKAAEAAATAKERRDIALENLRSQNDATNAATSAATNHTNKIAEIHETAVQDDWKNSRQNARTTSSQIAVDKAKTSNDAYLERLKTQYGLSADKELAVQKALLDATARGQTIKNTVVGTDGTLFGLTETGSRVTLSGKGMFNPTGKADADNDVVGSFARSPGAAAATAAANPAPKPAPKPTAKAAPSDGSPWYAPGAAPTPKPAAMPSRGEVQGGYRFKGGDPSVQSNWEKVK